MKKIKLFPTHVFPHVIQDALDDYCQYYEVDRSLAYSTLMTIIGQMYSDTTCVFESFQSRPNLFMVQVAEAGCSKSYMFDIFEQAYSHFVDVTKTESTSGADVNLLVNNFTAEGITKIVENNQKSGINNRVLINQDEASALFNSFGKYQQGGGVKGNGERDFLKSAFSGKVESQTRSGESRLISNKSYISLLTSIQPDVMKAFFKNTYDGFADRFLYAYNSVDITIPFKRYIPNDYIEKCNRYLCELIDGGLSKNLVLDISEEDYEEFHTTLNSHLSYILDKYDRSKMQKMKQNYFSFCIILAVLNGKDKIDIDITRDALELVDYFMSVYQLVEEITEDEETIIKQEIINMIKKDKHKSYLIMNGSRKLKTYFKKDRKKLDAMLLSMQSSGELEFDGSEYTITEDV